MSNHSQQAAERFDRWANSYSKDRISPWFRFYQQAAISKANLQVGDNFLDVGCGTGWAVREVAKQIQTGKACGIDISPQMIVNASAQTPEEQNYNIELQVASSEAIPYADNYFNSIICTFSIHHYQNPVRALSEMKRVLKKDGLVIILDSARDVFFPIWLQDRGRRYFEQSHVKYYTTKEMKALVAEAELNLVEPIATVRKFRDHSKMFTGLMFAICSK